MTTAATPSARWRRYARFYRDARGAIVASVLLSIVQSALVLPIAALVRRAFDIVIPSGDTTALFGVAAALVGLYAANVSVTLFTRHLILSTVKRGIARLRSELLDRLYLYSPSFHGRADRGRVHATIVHDTERVDHMSNALLGHVLPSLVVCAALAAWLALIDWRLLAAALAVGPALVAVNRLVGSRVRDGVARFHGDFEDFSRGTLVALTAIELTRAQTAEPHERARLAGIVARVAESGHRVAWLSSAYTLLQGAITAAGAIVILVVGGMAVGRGAMTHGELASFYVALMLLAGQASVVLANVPNVIGGDASLDALIRLLDAVEPPVYTGRLRVPFRGDVALHDVRFSHDGRDLLRGISFEVRPGTITAIVGPNGSGKTTLLNLVLGFLRPHDGRIAAAGHPYDELDLDHLRRSVGVVMQDALLLPGTIWENLTYGLAGVDRADVDRACALASAGALISSSPSGYDTLVGDGGVALSGGERQRLALARALVRKPALLVLDEPTTHLDADAASRLIGGLTRLPEHPAVLIATHDTALCAIADAVVSLPAGTAASRHRARSAGGAQA